MYMRPLYFDYKGATATGRAQFIEWYQTPHGHFVSPTTVDFLRPGQKVDVVVELLLPDRRENDALFMINGTLETAAGAVLYRSHRPLLVEHRPFVFRLLRSTAFWPLHALGLLQESQVKRVPLALDYKELKEAPLAAVTVHMQATGSKATPPTVYSATVVLYSKLGWLQYGLSFFRLHQALHVVLVIVATTLMLVSSLAGMCMCVLGMQTAVDYLQPPLSAEEAAEAPMVPTAPLRAAARLPEAVDSSGQAKLVHGASMRSKVRSAEQLGLNKMRDGGAASSAWAHSSASTGLHSAGLATRPTRADMGASSAESGGEREPAMSYHMRKVHHD